MTAIRNEKSRKLYDLILKAYPGWTGFTDPRFVKDEIGYKQKTIQKAKELLSESELRRLIENQDQAEFINRLEIIGRDNNLLYLRIPKASDLSILSDPNLDRPEFCRMFFDLLYGSGKTSERLERFSAYASKNGLPNKWPFPTYFLFICHPDAEMFVKPMTIKWFLEFMDSRDEWTVNPSARIYEMIMEYARVIKEGFQEFKSCDMVDIQSLIWVGARIAGGKFNPVKRKKRKEFEALFSEFETDYLSTEQGEEHYMAYEKGREIGRLNFEAVIQAQQAGQDITDQVLLKLLPYKDSPSNREKGAWIHIAPCITDDIRTWYQNAGWVKADEWPGVSARIFDFLKACEKNPDQLEQYCSEFSRESLSGFQSGILSPILNAIRPDSFMIVNKKSLQVINHFCEEKYKQSIADYPKVNSKGKSLIAAIPEYLSEEDPRIEHPDRVFDMFCHWMVALKKYKFGDTRYWKIAPGGSAWNWERCLKEGFIAIGWDDFGDVSKLTKEEFQAKNAKLAAGRAEWGAEGARQVWTFSHIKEGDRIVANNGTQEVLGIGTVIGDYYFVENEKHGHRLPVEWNDTTKRKVDEGGWRRTIVKLDEGKFEEICDSEPIPPGNGPEPWIPLPPAVQPEYPLEELGKKVGFELSVLEGWVRGIERKRQAIFYGPPGTGKTYVALELAKHLIGGGDGFCEIVQFHPSYAYEDFVIGIRPQAAADGQLQYPSVPGRFLEFCRKAQSRKDKCILIIDEINRANLSRVFGELMYLLEYRESEVSLAGGRVFKIPENVYLIGTMNTADRSIALVDHALRRRFAFLSLYPNYEILRRFHEGKDFPLEKLIDVLRQLNAEIGDRHYEVGITFFLQENLREKIADIWRMEIEPYLEEYFFDRSDKVEQFRWEAVQGKILQ